MIPRIPILNVRSLFAVAVILKVTFAGVGWLIGDPVILGTLTPLVVMAVYIVLGYQNRGNEISEEKFADSCYYIGFIFTIVTIIFSLLDIPRLTPGQGLTEVAWRFGAAMTSTVMGMIVRVWMVGFRKDVGDSVRDVEARLVHAANEFVNQFELVRQRLQTLDATVLDSVNATVASIGARMEMAGKEQADAMREFHAALLVQTENTSKALVNDLNSASGSIRTASNEWATGLNSAVSSFDSELMKATRALHQRLSGETLPKEFFVAQFKPALEELKAQAADFGQSVQHITEEVENSAAVLSKGVRGLDNKLKRATDVQRVLESFEQVVNTHASILGAIQTQQAAVEQVVALLNASEQRLVSVVGNVPFGVTLSPDVKRAAEPQPSSMNAYADVPARGEVSEPARVSQAQLPYAPIISAIENLQTKRSGVTPQSADPPAPLLPATAQKGNAALFRPHSDTSVSLPSTNRSSSLTAPWRITPERVEAARPADSSSTGAGLGPNPPKWG